MDPGLRRALRRLRAHVRLALFAAMAMILVGGTARAGSTYVFCSVMDEQRAEPCCQKETPAAPKLSEADCDCCEIQALCALPAAASVKPPHVAPASRVAVLLASAIVEASSLGADSTRPARPPARTGPPPDVDRTRLMVFLN